MLYLSYMPDLAVRLFEQSIKLLIWTPCYLKGKMVQKKQKTSIGLPNLGIIELREITSTCLLLPLRHILWLTLYLFIMQGSGYFMR